MFRSHILGAAVAVAEVLLYLDRFYTPGEGATFVIASQQISELAQGTVGEGRLEMLDRSKMGENPFPRLLGEDGVYHHRL